MTNKEFFEMVKGKKIYYGNNKIYFIPKKLFGDLMVGTTYNKDGTIKRRIDSWYIANGFNEWKFFEETDKPVKKENKMDVLKQLSSRFFRISFQKKDGTIREICARLPKEKHSNPDYLLIYDTKAQCLKTVIKKNIILIKQGSKFWR